MTTLLIVRHGQSMGNVEDRFIGHTDSPLSDLGILQAEKTAEYIAENYKIDKIYSSDLSRAFVTAEKIAKKLDMDVFTDKRLREIYAGQWETLPFDFIRKNYEKDFNVWLNDIGNSGCTGGETVAQLQKRAAEAMEDIAKENCGKTVLVATHATVIKTLQCLWHKKSLDEMKNITPWVTNASVTTVKYENGEFSFITEGYDEHLGSFTSALPENI